MNSIELRQERAKLVAEARKTVDLAESEKRALSGEENQMFDKYMAEVDRLAEEADKVEKRERVETLESGLKTAERKLAKPEPYTYGKIDARTRHNAFKGWLKGGTDIALSTDERSACEQMGYSPYQNSISLTYEKRDPGQMGSTAGTWAGWGAETAVVYPGVVSYIQAALKSYGNFFNTSTVIPTVNGVAFNLPTVNDTGEVAALTAQAGTITPTSMTTSSVAFSSYAFTRAILITKELLQDSILDIEQFAAQQLAISVGRTLNNKFCTGSGSSDIQGIVTGSTSSGVTLTGSGSPATIASDDVLDFIRTVDPAYRNQNFGIIMHDNTLGLIRKLKDSNGQYLWSASPGGYNNQLGAADPDRLNGYPVYVNNGMPTFAASAKIAVCGDLSCYYIRQVQTVDLVRLNELYALNREVGLVLSVRYDARVYNAGTNPIKYLAVGS